MHRNPDRDGIKLQIGFGGCHASRTLFTLAQDVGDVDWQTTGLRDTPTNSSRLILPCLKATMETYK